MVYLSIGHIHKPCKMAELIEMPIGRLTRMGPMNHVLDGGRDPPWEGAIPWVVQPTEKHWQFLLWVIQSSTMA